MINLIMSEMLGSDSAGHSKVIAAAAKQIPLSP